MLMRGVYEKPAFRGEGERTGWAIGERCRLRLVEVDRICSTYDQILFRWATSCSKLGAVT